jgi:hypothetical protein
MLESYFQRTSGVIYSGINFLPALLLFSLEVESEKLSDVSSAVLFAPLISSMATFKGENIGLIFSRNFQNYILYFNVLLAALISIYSINLGSIVMLYSLNLLAFYRKDLENSYTFLKGLIMAIAGISEIFLFSSLKITSLVFFIIVVYGHESQMAIGSSFNLVQEFKQNIYYVIQVTVIMGLSLWFLALLNKALVNLNDLEGYVKSTRLIGVYMAFHGNILVRSYFISQDKILNLRASFKLALGLVIFMFSANYLLDLLPYKSVLFQKSPLWWYVALDAAITTLKNVMVPVSLRNKRFNLYIYILLLRIIFILLIDINILFYSLIIYEIITLIILFLFVNETRDKLSEK